MSPCVFNDCQYAKPSHLKRFNDCFNIMHGDIQMVTITIVNVKIFSTSRTRSRVDLKERITRRRVLGEEHEDQRTEDAGDMFVQ